MSMTSFKLLAAVLLTCGLGLGVGSGWMATADAQPPGNQLPSKVDPEAEVKRLQVELEKAQLALLAAKQSQDAQSDVAAALALFAAAQKTGEESNSAKRAKWEYDFAVVTDISQTKFVEFLHDRENLGWEFNGTTTLKHDGKPTAFWVFRRPTKQVMAATQSAIEYLSAANSAANSVKKNPGTPPEKQLNDAKAIEAEITRLQEKLTTLKEPQSQLVFLKDNLPLDPVLLGKLLAALADKKFAKGRCSISIIESGIAVAGDKEVIEWATGLIKKLSEK